jgi:hypothetical protein
MSRPLLMIAIFLCVLAIVFWLTSFGGNVALILLGISVLLGQISLATGR